ALPPRPAPRRLSALVAFDCSQPSPCLLAPAPPGRRHLGGGDGPCPARRSGKRPEPGLGPRTQRARRSSFAGAARSGVRAVYLAGVPHGGDGRSHDRGGSRGAGIVAGGGARRQVARPESLSLRDRRPGGLRSCPVFRRSPWALLVLSAFLDKWGVAS